ncbi:MAG: SPOR domain-containing protein [Betaproteobacteria bacterium]|nr:SPOR domain-containing protein [Betaproteobacteria bacterium]
MADRTPDTPELAVDQLKRKARRRLVGAVVLALAAAVVLPLLLEKEPKPLGEDVSVRIPSIDDTRLVSKLPGKEADAPSVAVKAAPVTPSAPVDATPATASPPAPAPAKASPSAGAAVEPKSAPAAPTPAAPKKSLAEAEQRLLAPTGKPVPAPETTPKTVSAATTAGTPAAMPPSTAKAETPAAAPPPPAKAEPPAAAAVPPPAKATTPPAAAPAAPTAATPAAPATPAREGFVVQLAAFADDKGANALAGKLKKSGYAAYVEPVQTSRGTLWRVRVGGYAARADAEAARAKLKAEGQNGIVVPAK